MSLRKWFSAGVLILIAAGSTTVAPLFMKRASAADGFATSVAGQASISVGSGASFTVSATDQGGGLGNAVVDFEVDSISGQQIFQKYFTGQNFGGGQTLSYSIPWTPSAAGSYVAKVGVFTANWANLAAWNNNALDISVVAQPAVKFSANGSADPSSPSTGTQASLSGTVTNTGTGSASNVTVMLEVANAAGTNVYQQLFYGQNFGAGQSQTYNAQWTPSVAGSYTLNVGVFEPDWSSLLGWMGDIASMKVSQATFAAANMNSATKFYVDPNSSAALAAQSMQSSDPSGASILKMIANQPVATWFGGWDTNVYQDVNTLVAAAAQQGTVPVLVAYNIPDRDCGGYSAGGAQTASEYQSWIQSFAAGIGSHKAVVILEPDALADMDCLSAADQATRLNLLSGAVQTLKALGNTAVYLDAGNSNWISASQMASRLQSADISTADGFALNTSNFYTTASNEAYGTALSALVGGKHFVIDTSRNGDGPTSDDAWCNPSGRALGALPTTNTGNALVDAFLWIKPPGESDGTCNGGPTAGTFWAQYAIGLAQQAGY